MAFLGPRIRKQDQNLLHAQRRHLCGEHLHRVVADDAHVAQLLRLEGEQQPPDPRAMHLDAEEVALRVRTRKPQQVIPVAEADLDRAGGRARVQRAQVQRLGGELEPVLGPQLGERTLLRRRDAPGPRHEGAYRAWMFDFGHKARRAPERSLAFDSNGSARPCAAEEASRRLPVL